jgi:solute carrier family 25, member 39/40
MEPSPPSSSVSSSDNSLLDSDYKMGFSERAIAAAGAAVVSAILVNPLDVAKVYVQRVLLFFVEFLYLLN